MTFIFHALLPIWFWSMIFQRPFLINWHDVPLVNGFMLLLGIVGSAPDWIPLIGKWYGWGDRVYTRIHQPWQFGKKWQRISYGFWIAVPILLFGSLALHWPLGIHVGAVCSAWVLHCLCDIPVHRPDASLKNFWLDATAEFLLLLAIILTRNVWYVRIV